MYFITNFVPNPFKIYTKTPYISTVKKVKALLYTVKAQRVHTVVKKSYVQ